MARQWCFLIHQIPPTPLYLRAQVRQRLSRVGAIALKKSVYVLPHTNTHLEDFQWIAEIITKGSGQAWIIGGHVLGGLRDDELVSAFQAARASDYARLRAESAALIARDPVAGLTKLRERVEAVRAIDFFPGPAGEEAERMLSDLTRKTRPPRPRRPGGVRLKAGRTWVTRADVGIDRIASAWLIRRHIDSSASFRFVDERRWTKATGEVAFDIVDGDYTHEGDRCTFETLVARFGIRNQAVSHLAEIVHDLDLKDDRFGRREAPGVQLLIDGLAAASRDDQHRVTRGVELFDELARALDRPRRKRSPR